MKQNLKNIATLTEIVEKPYQNFANVGHFEIEERLKEEEMLIADI